MTASGALVYLQTNDMTHLYIIYIDLDSIRRSQNMSRGKLLRNSHALKRRSDVPYSPREAPATRDPSALDSLRQHQAKAHNEQRRTWLQLSPSSMAPSASFVRVNSISWHFGFRGRTKPFHPTAAMPWLCDALACAKVCMRKFRMGKPPPLWPVRQ